MNELTPTSPADWLVEVIIPVFNEQEALLAFHAQLCAVVDALPYPVRILYVDDGSSDNTPALLRSLAAADPRVRALHLSRNFGHQAALTAGLDHAEGDLVITLDGDGQHPPELIPQMIDLARHGYDVVLTQRQETAGESAFKRWTSESFYHLINRMGDTKVLPGAADYRLLRKPVVLALRQMREYHRFLRGMVPWMGFKTVILPYQQPERLAGKSKYSLKKMVRLAMDAVFSFSLTPLYFGISMGGALLLLAALEMIYVLAQWAAGRGAQLAPGWSSLMFVLLVIGGILSILLGFIGMYIGYIFQEVKGRPIYLVREESGKQP